MKEKLANQAIRGLHDAMQLRDLVPSQLKETASSSQDNLDPSKRPKHVVLSDTIMLVKSLQQKVQDWHYFC